MRYQMTMRPTERAKIRVETALISGVMPRRRRPQISSGKVLSRPIRKKVTAISSMESVKMSRAAAISESLRFGSVMRQKVCQGVAPRSREASSWARSIFCKPAKNEAAEEGFSREIRAIEGERGQQTEGQRERHAASSHHQAINDGIPNRGVAEKLSIPIEREMAGRETADAVTIEGIKNEDGDREINEDKNERGINLEEGSATICSMAIHRNDHRFSSRSLRKSK